MRRRFRLATVERLRTTALDKAAQSLALARQEVGLAITRRDAVADELAGCVGGSGPGQLEAAQARRSLLRERLEAAGQDVTAARERAAAALAAWTSARADLRAVEILHDRHRAELAADDARREQRLVDDLAGTRRRILGDEVA